MCAESDGRRTFWRNKGRKYDNVSGRVLGCKLDSSGSGWESVAGFVKHSNAHCYNRVTYKCMQILQKSLIPCWLDRVLHKWFIAVHSRGKAMTGPMIIAEAESFDDEMKIIDKCTFFNGWLWRSKIYLQEIRWV